MAVVLPAPVPASITYSPSAPPQVQPILYVYPLLALDGQQHSSVKGFPFLLRNRFLWRLGYSFKQASRRVRYFISCLDNAGDFGTTRSLLPMSSCFSFIRSRMWCGLTSSSSVIRLNSRKSTRNRVAARQLRREPLARWRHSQSYRNSSRRSFKHIKKHPFSHGKTTKERVQKS